MGLTEIEKAIIGDIQTMTKGADSCTPHHTACACINRTIVGVINRLVSENEELQSRLDAIGKAWEPFMKRREDIAKCFMRPLASDTDILVENQYFEALDRLI